MTTQCNALSLLVVLVLVLSFPRVHKCMVSYDRQTLLDLRFDVYSAPALAEGRAARQR